MFQIRGKNSHHSAKHHGYTGQEQQQVAPENISVQKRAGNHDHSKDAGFCQNTGKKRGSWSRSNRVRLWEPDMQRKNPGFCGKSNKNQCGGPIEG